MSVIRALVAVLLIAGSAAASPAVTYTWTGGGGANTNWSSPANWGGSGPGNGEGNLRLVFPALAGTYSANNDLTGLQVVALDIATQLDDGQYLFTGNALTVSGAATMASPGSGNPNLVWQIPVSLAGDFSITASGRQTQLRGDVDLGSHTLTLDTLGDIVLAGTVSGSGNLVKINTSALTITGSNTYTGTTTSNAGALYIDGPDAFGATATGTTFNGGFLGFGGGAFTTAEPFLFNGGGILAYGTPSMAGQVTLDKTTDMKAFEQGSILTIDAPIVGSGGLTKSGPGRLILAAPSELYEGATSVDAGTLQLDAGLASTAALTVRHTAVLQGDGSSAGTVRVQDGGTIAPGSSPGRLSSAGLEMVGGAAMAVEIDGPSSTQYDALTVSGPVDLGGATLAITLGYAPLDGQQFTLISHLQGEPVLGTFAGLPEGAAFQVGTTVFGITYKGGAGSDVVLLAGPPATLTSTATVPTPTTTETTAAAATATATHTAGVATPTPTLPSVVTPTRTHAASGTPTSTLTATRTPVTAAATATATATPPIGSTPTATETPPFCTGDCDGSRVVLVNELVVGVNIALDKLPLGDCPAFDADGGDRVTVEELIQAVGNALSGCP